MELIPNKTMYVGTELMTTLEGLSYHRMTWNEVFKAISNAIARAGNGTDLPVSIKMAGADGDTPCTVVAPDNETCMQLRLCHGPEGFGLIVTPNNLVDAFMALSGTYGDTIDDEPAIFGRDINDPEDVAFIKSVGMIPMEEDDTLLRIVLMMNRDSAESELFEDAMLDDDDGEDDEE